MDDEHCPTPGYNDYCPTPGYDCEPISPNTADLFDHVQEQEEQAECVRYSEYCPAFLMALRRQDTESVLEAEDSEMPEAMPSSPSTLGGHDASNSEPEEHDVVGSDSHADQEDSTDTSQGEHDDVASQLTIKELRNTIQEQGDLIQQQQRVMEAQHDTIASHVTLISELGHAACMQQMNALEKRELEKEKQNAVGAKRRRVEKV